MFAGIFRSKHKRRLDEVAYAYRGFFALYGRKAPELRDRGIAIIGEWRKLPLDLPAPVIAARLAQQLIRGELTSGRHHVYRGSLSSHGVELFNIYTFGYQHRARFGDPDVETLANLQDLNELGEEIARVG